MPHTKPPSDDDIAPPLTTNGDTSWPAHRLMLLDRLAKLEGGQKRVESGLNRIENYISGQKAITSMIGALFGIIGASVVHLFFGRKV